jgi:hypothetical protein
MSKLANGESGNGVGALLRRGCLDGEHKDIWKLECKGRVYSAENASDVFKTATMSSSSLQAGA